MLKIKAVKKLKGFTLNVDFETSERITAIFAPSGSGKSLTLDIIAGLVKPDKGFIKVKERILFDFDKGINLPPQKRKIGYLFQNFALFPHLTVYENILFGATENVRGRIEELMEIFEIKHLSFKKPSQISGGQKQRVALARAIATEPELLLLDEPFSALDKSLKERLYDEILKVSELFDISIIFVSHDFDEVLHLADFIVIYDKGTILQTGTPSEVFANPLNEKVATVLGFKNIFKGVLIRKNDEYYFKVKNLEIPFHGNGNFSKSALKVLIPSYSFCPAKMCDETVFDAVITKAVVKGFCVDCVLKTDLGLKLYATFSRRAFEKNLFKIGEKYRFGIFKDKIRFLES